MRNKRIAIEELRRWVAALIRSHKVYGAQAKGALFAFDELRRAEDLRLDYDVTILPPRKYLQPQKEALLRFSANAEYESILDDTPFVIFGVHPYDMAAIAQMDRIFSMKNCDLHYMRRRKNAAIIVSDVEQASPHVFAGCMGNATVEGRDGFDALLTRLDDGSYIAESRSAKGEDLMAPLADAADASPAQEQQRRAVWERNRATLRKHELKMAPSQIPALLEKAAAHPVWEEKARLCYSCGSCNLVCPTCYCFDVADEVNWDLKSGHRVRQWDGCMLRDFASVAGGHNFRSSRTARYRHRYYRKGKYVPEMIGEISCVGCGRCIGACTAKIANPVEVFNRLLEDR